MELLELARRILVIEGGRLIFDGTTVEAQSSTNAFVRQFVHGLTEGPL